MKHAPGSPNIDSRLFGILLGPSWLSGVTIMLVSVASCFGIVLVSRYQASSIRLDFLDYQAGQVSHTYQSVNNDLLSNPLFSNLPLLVFWGLVGIVVYLFAANILTAIHDTAELTNELHYVHADRHKLLWGPARRLFIRLVTLSAWFVYMLFFLHHVVPYCIAASIVASAQFQVWQSSTYVLLAIGVLAAALHVHTIFLRLFLLRPRVFSSTLYADIEES